LIKRSIEAFLNVLHVDDLSEQSILFVPVSKDGRIAPEVFAATIFMHEFLPVGIVEAVRHACCLRVLRGHVVER